jgi:hypothetical protein
MKIFVRNKQSEAMRRNNMLTGMERRFATSGGVIR